MVLWLNYFMATHGISENHSPREIVTGREAHFNKHFKAVLCSNVEASKDTTVRNIMNPKPMNVQHWDHHKIYKVIRKN